MAADICRVSGKHGESQDIADFSLLGVGSSFC
jgi:hypothetical protein